MLKKTILIYFLILYVIIISACNSTGPTENNGNGQDTTSHNFSWQTFSFGEHSSSILYDVAIINDTSIWAVGEIYLNDSLGSSDPTPYNAIHWNGSEWNIERIPTKTFSGSLVSSQIRTILCFDKNNIWTFSVAGSYSHWDGNNWESEFVSERIGSGNKIWGESSSDIYLVCNNGGISHYDGTKWEKIDTGLDLDIYDIWGAKTASGDYEILCVASDQFKGTGKKVLQIKNNIVNTLPDTGLSNSLNTIWFVPGKKYFIGGDGLFSSQSLGTNWTRNTELPAYYKTSVRGNDLNDLFVAGAYGLLLHYNGQSWMNYQDITYISGSYGKVDIKGDFVCVVGNNNNQAAIIIGKRQ